MVVVLLKTKLHIPPVHSGQVPRARLFERLDAGLPAKLALISAPAGAGKTSLISAWVRRCGLPTAWFSADRDDNDPTRFWMYFIAALQSVQDNLGREMQSYLSTSQSPAFDVLLSGLINELEEFSGRLVFVLDDFHLIESNQIHETMMFFQDHMPASMHMILSTRADPPWPLARLRAKGEMTEIRLDDLRFTLDETTAFMNTMMGLALSSEEVLALDARLEGWIAGLQMSALSMQGREDKSGFIRAFTGSHRFILDFLVEEVLLQQPAEIQEFLLKTSVLERLMPALCNAVTAREDSQDVLMMIEKANLFLTPLDDERRWYRYHLLFGDLLRGTLEQRWPGEVPGLHQRASRWYAENGMVPEAVNHAFAAGDVEYVAQLIEENALAIITVYNEHLPALVRWLDALPQEVLNSRPWLMVASAWALAYSGDLDAAEAVIQASERVLFKLPLGFGDKDIDKERLAGHIAAIRGYQAFMRGDISLSLALTEKALQDLPKGDIALRVFAMVTLGAAVGMQGDLKVSVRLLSEAYNLCREARNDLLTIMVLCELAALQILGGHLKRASATCETALQLSDVYARRVGQSPPVIGFAHARLSYALREQNDLEAATYHAQEAVRISSSWGQKDSLSMSHVYLALALQAAGKSEESVSVMKKARQLGIGLSHSEDVNVTAYTAKLHLMQGDMVFVSGWLEKSGLTINDELPFNRVREYIVFAQFLIALEKWDDSLTLLRRLSGMVEDAGATLFMAEILILKARVLHAQGDVDQAMLALEYALRLAEAEGYVRIFIDQGVKMIELLRQAVDRGISAQYAYRLLSALEASGIAKTGLHEPPAQSGIAEAQNRLIEPLTRREVEILKLLMTDLSIVEISDELCISVNTLRTHIKHIYEKLEIHNRMEVIARGREFGLL